GARPQQPIAGLRHRHRPHGANDRHQHRHRWRHRHADRQRQRRGLRHRGRERQHRIYTHADDRRACADRHRHRQLRRPCHQRPVRPDRLQRPERADAVARSRLDQRHGVSAGSWAFMPTTSLAAGTYDLTARATDPYGDVTTGTFDLTVVPAPTAPTLALALSSQSPDFATDTDHTAPTIDISTGIAGGTVTLTANGSVVASGTADANGSIALAPTLTIGAHALTATVTDSYGDHASSTPLDLTVYAVPNAPTLRLAPASITGTVTYATDIGTPRIDVGTDADAASVTLSANGTVAFTGTEVSAGSWAFTPTTSLAAGTYDLTARVTDPYGDVTTGTFALTVA